MRVSRAVQLTSPDPVVRETAREAVRHILIAYRERATPDPLDRDQDRDTPEQIAVRRAALQHAR